MRWNYFLTVCALAVFNGVARALIDGISHGKWESGIAGFFVFLMLGGPFGILADFIAWRRAVAREARNHAGRSLPNTPPHAAP